MNLQLADDTQKFRIDLMTPGTFLEDSVVATNSFLLKRLAENQNVVKGTFRLYTDNQDRKQVCSLQLVVERSNSRSRSSSFDVLGSQAPMKVSDVA